MNIRNSFSFWLAACASLAASYAYGETLTYSSGTGFYISSDGYLLTNNHVVAACKNTVSVYGAGATRDAAIIARDPTYDLALLKTSGTTSQAALSSDKQPLRAGDPVVVVGYPGQSWETGKTQTRDAQILDTKGPRGEEKWLQFTDSLARGNSGGPLLDSAGNVVGVVVAKARLVIHNEAAAREETVQTFDLAISLPVIRPFLEANNVRYREADSGIYLSPDRVTDIAHNFVVNVRCKLER